MRAPEKSLSHELPGLAADVLERLRARSPRVHCITNNVAQAFTANILLAAGAIPTMTLAPDEVASFIAGSEALLINLGTFDAERREAIDIALVTALDERVPWVLDPVFIERSEARARYARELVAKKPRAVRLNATEFAALGGSAADARTLADYARGNLTVIGLTGEADLVGDGARFTTIHNGHPFMARVTAMGCAASALTAACHAIEADAYVATAAALILLGVAGEVAGARARGPGSFAVEILDAVHGLDRATITRHARVT
ncbi:MAG: hydroxyethylthiazole kinase [Rhizobiales bacterium]|nr:hydroxyethylthiazole kinase [Hyphomicrobiales bacterium]